MTKKEFIKEIRELADNLEKGSFHFIQLREGKYDSYIFGNRNYGEIRIPVGCASLTISLYTATDEEKKEFEDDDTV